MTTWTASVTRTTSAPPSWVRDAFRLLVAALFPPLGVFLRVRFTAHFFVSLVLTLVGYIPGMLHAVWVLARRTEDLYPFNRR